MRIWILSDLHTENLFENVWVPGFIPDADVCVVAGDIAGNPAQTAAWLERHIRPSMPVVGVVGAHEHYGNTIERTASLARACSGDMSMLQDGVVVIDGVRFIGSTLWSSTNAGDHEFIGSDAGGFSEAMADALFRESRAYIESVLAEPFDGDTVLVTHHAPSPGLIDRYQPTIWIHGQVHGSADHKIGRTRVVCNARGYGGENADFDPGLVIKLGGPKPRPGGP